MFPPLAFLLSLAVVEAEPLCPDFWLETRGQCYWTSDFAVPWHSISTECQLLSPASRPASVHSMLENAVLMSLLSDHQAWLGLSRNTSSGNFRWLDGTAVDFTFWEEGQPSSDGTCVSINANNVTGQWAAIECDWLNGFVCQMAAGDVCPEGWWRYDSGCYLLNTTQIHGHEVASACSAIHPAAQPISIHSNEANEHFMAKLDGLDNAAWIGLRERRPGGDWSWEDGSPLDFQRWPYPASGSHLYVAVANSNYRGSWYTYDNRLTWSFFCQIIL